MTSCGSACVTVYERRASHRGSTRSIFMMIPARCVWVFDRGFLALVLLATPAFSTGTWSPCASTNVDSETNRTMPAPGQINSRTELKVIAEGFQSSITKPFIAIIRDADTYEALRRAAGNLPDTSVDFNSHILIAAFLGERNTGGYSVEMAIEVGGSFDTSGPARPYIRIKEKTPEKGTMVPQLITYPFKVVSLEVNPTVGVLIAPDSPWQQPMQHYLVTGGSFTMTGGIAGRIEQFKPQGNLWIMRLRNLATIMFMVFSPDKRPTGMLADFATGVVDADSSIKINRMSADTFVDAPNSGLKAMVKSVGEGKLLVSLTSLPLMVADGYNGMGTIEATGVDSAAKP
jgi:hypothetical protein